MRFGLHVIRLLIVASEFAGTIANFKLQAERQSLIDSSIEKTPIAAPQASRVLFVSLRPEGVGDCDASHVEWGTSRLVVFLNLRRLDNLVCLCHQTTREE